MPKLKCTDDFSKIKIKLRDMVYYACFDDSIIIASFSKMEYYLLDSSAAIFFNTIIESNTLDIAILKLEEYFNDDKHIFLEDLIDWCNNMINKGVITIKRGK